MGPQPILPSVPVNYGDRASPISFVPLYMSGLGSCRTVDRIVGAKTNRMETQRHNIAMVEECHLYTRYTAESGMHRYLASHVGDLEGAKRPRL
jgi:hypothetical protein